MMKKLSKKEIKRRAKKIQTIYQKYLVELREIKKKQNEIINKFIKELEKRKIEEIKKTIE